MILKQIEVKSSLIDDYTNCYIMQDEETKEVSNNEGLQNKLIEAIVQNENFKSDIERLIALMIPKNQQKTSDRETSLKELR